MQLKTLLAATVSRQTAYRLRENRFRHSYGTQLPPVQLKRDVFDCDEEMLVMRLSDYLLGLFLDVTFCCVLLFLMLPGLILAFAGLHFPHLYVYVSLYLKAGRLG